MLSGGLRTKNSTRQSQENRPIITVVTVVRNGEKTLEETILSVINQTYTNIEYIIIDGASTDGTLDIIRKYEDRIDYWMSESDEGIYYAMNKGIDLATGEWINFMNSGDCFCNESVVEILFKEKKVKDVIYGDFVLNDTWIKVCFGANSLDKFNAYIPFCHQSAFIRTSIQKKYQFNCKYKISADYDFFKNIFEAGYLFEYIPVSISLFKSGGISSSVLRYKENSLINDTYKDRNWYFGFIFYRLIVCIKKILNKLLPDFVVKKYKIKLLKRNHLVKDIWIQE